MNEKTISSGMRTFLMGAAVLSAAMVAAPEAQAGVIRGISPDAAAMDAPYINVADARVEGARAFIDKMAGQAIEFLGNDKMSDAQKRASFRKLLQGSFDMPVIGKFALGTYWRTATEAQRAEYQKLFQTMVVDVYSQRFSEYTNQKFRATGARADGERDLIVASVIESPSGQPPVRVDWRVREAGGQYKVIDVMVEGVSMALTQRADFSSVIQSGGGNIEVLLKHLRQKNG